MKRFNPYLAKSGERAPSLVILSNKYFKCLQIEGLFRTKVILQNYSLYTQNYRYWVGNQKGMEMMGKHCPGEGEKGRSAEGVRLVSPEKG